MFTLPQTVLCYRAHGLKRDWRELEIRWLALYRGHGESFHSNVILHLARCTAEAGSPPSEMQVSQRILFVSYRLSTMPGVVSHNIFPWSPVSTYKSQQCCQNSRTASAKSICKVSSWVIASSGALQYPVILWCLWPLSATQSFLQLS